MALTFNKSAGRVRTKITTSDTSCTVHIVFHFDEGVEGVDEDEGVMDFLALVQDSLPFPTYMQIGEPHKLRPDPTVYLAYLTETD